MNEANDWVGPSREAREKHIAILRAAMPKLKPETLDAMTDAQLAEFTVSLHRAAPPIREPNLHGANRKGRRAAKADARREAKRRKPEPAAAR